MVEPQVPIVIDTLGKLAESYRMWARCTHCKHEAEIDLAAAAERLGADTGEEAFVAALVCSRCGKRDLGITKGVRHRWDPWREGQGRGWDTPPS